MGAQQMDVMVPPGATAGQLLAVAPPNGGASFNVAVPAGVMPGQQFRVEFRVANPPAVRIPPEAQYHPEMPTRTQHGGQYYMCSF